MISAHFFPMRKAGLSVNCAASHLVSAKKENLPSGAMANMCALFSSYYNNYSVK